MFEQTRYQKNKMSKFNQQNDNITKTQGYQKTQYIKQQ